MKIAIYSSKDYEQGYLRNASYGTHELNFIEKPLSKQTVHLAKGYDVVSIFTSDDASEKVLGMLCDIGVEYMVLRCTGYNNVDLEAAKTLGLKVAHAPKYSPHSVAEHAIALMLALSRNLIKADRQVKEFNFSIDNLVGFELCNKTVGVIGVGDIGSVVVDILLGFGCKVLAYDPEIDQSFIDKGVVYVAFNDLLKESDIITLHLPLTEENKCIISEEEISRMKRGVMLINTSRGGLINTTDVIKGLKKQKIGYLGLDVYDDEKGLFFEDHSEDILQDDIIARLITFKNVMITSHQAFLTNTALHSIARSTFETINAWSLGEKSKNEI